MTDGLVAELARELGSGSEARWLVEEVDQQHPDATEEHRRFALRALVERRMAGVPLQYVLGHWAFRSLDLVVDPRVLIPRPETEQVVEMALAQLPIVAAGRPDPVVVDLGTGSGAVALALLTEGRVAYRELGVWATDIDPDALDVAALNLARSAPPDSVGTAFRLCRGRWWAALPDSLRGRVDLAVSNPPYVAAHEWAGLDPEVRLEPYRALVAEDGTEGTPGFAAVETVIADAPKWLAPSGVLVVEIAPHQAPAALQRATTAGLRSPRVERDLAGRDRALVAGGP